MFDRNKYQLKIKFPTKEGDQEVSLDKLDEERLKSLFAGFMGLFLQHKIKFRAQTEKKVWTIDFTTHGKEE